jgi:hypothetical protein
MRSKSFRLDSVTKTADDSSHDDEFDAVLGVSEGGAIPDIGDELMLLLGTE